MATLTKAQGVELLDVLRRVREELEAAVAKLREADEAKGDATRFLEDALNEMPTWPRSVDDDA